MLCVAGLETEGNQTEGNSESTLIRCNCCYNLPVETRQRLRLVFDECLIQLMSLPALCVDLQAMVVFSDSTHFLSELYPSFSGLCCDPEISVRRSAAASFHQV